MSENLHQCEHRSCYCRVTGARQYCSDECRGPAPDQSECECDHEECEERAGNGAGKEEPAPRKKKAKDKVFVAPGVTFKVAQRS